MTILVNGSTEINLMIGGNVTDEWKKATNKVIARTLTENVGSLLNGEIQYSTLFDNNGVVKKKITITYQEEE